MTPCEEAVVIDDERFIQQEASRFLEGAALVARLVRKADPGPSDPVVDFIARGGLSQNVDAARVVEREYRRFLLDYASAVESETVIAALRLFYDVVRHRFDERGVQL